jgi:hypothetical protein
MSVLELFLVKKDVTLNIVLFFTTLEQQESSSELSSSSDDFLDSDDSKQKKKINMKRTIAASWATYRRMRAEGKIGDMPLKLTPMRKADQLIKYYDDNGLFFAPICKPANDDDVKCFDSLKNKTCDHKVDKVVLNEVGQYVIFPSRWWHRGFYEIRSEKEYYTVQLFCTAAQDPESWTNQLRKDNRNMKIGRIPVYQMNEVSNDIKDNWNTTYAESKFPPSKAFDGNKIDPGTNRHLQGDTFRKILHMDNLVKYFESRFRQFYVKSVWIIKKTRDNDGFQGWHRDFYLNTDVISTIVVNVGVCEMK